MDRHVPGSLSCFEAKIPGHPRLMHVPDAQESWIASFFMLAPRETIRDNVPVRNLRKGAMSSSKRGVTTPEMASPPTCPPATVVAADAEQAGVSLTASLWARFGTWPPAARLVIAVLLSLMLWVPIWFGVRAGLRAFG
ncbi:hypothetical protein [Neoroseomonas soli]|uniref:Uncharacterized protein n=1 Tax=Neoroseomonas soli TaxID=1081025 RepID=A0A9X9WSZ7_9PROT|nr:hypothetical protein [Neoroseomonas soli]MBR0670276.1 hypothetical protein [Neoroseomonas soli]